MKLTTGLENFKSVVSDDLSFASVEIDKNSFFQRPREAEKRDPGNEVEKVPGCRACAQKNKTWATFRLWATGLKCNLCNGGFHMNLKR